MEELGLVTSPLSSSPHDDVAWGPHSLEFEHSSRATSVYPIDPQTSNMADNEKEELRPTTAADTEAAAAGSEGQSQEQKIGKPPKEP
ncbi:MAG: hypothetical protein L6R42_006931, partial [Xanthoria sp. 1 TBL-2021]